MNIKNYKNLVPLVLVVLMVLSWYSLFAQNLKINKQFNGYLSEARKNVELGIEVYATENFLKALSLKEDIDIRIEVANYYKDTVKKNRYINWCEETYNKYPTSAKAVDTLLDAYLQSKDYESCFKTIRTATKRNVKSNFISETETKIAYEYYMDFYTYNDVSVYSNNYSAVQSKDLWGFVDRFGKVRIACKYKYVGQFTSTGIAPVIDKDDNAFFIDKSGVKVRATNEAVYTAFGNFADDMFTAQIDEKYIYLNTNFKKTLGDYDYATTMNNGVAAIKMADTWKLINSTGKEIGGNYIDVVKDEKSIVFRNDRLFVKSDDKYFMIDGTGKNITDKQYDNAKMFLSESLAAVKIENKWGFINSKGEMKIEPQFENARSFLNGLAAVQIAGKWGFIDETGKVMIEPKFFDAKDFNEKGSCFVKVGDNWQLLKLYRLNIDN